MNTPIVRPNYMTPRQLVELYPSIKLRTLRYWISHASPRQVSYGGAKKTLPGNGLEPALIRKGRITLIDEAQFFEWLRR
ncbi:MAG: hypothetical protein M3O15_12525 [Acidobacteriota bacterium]|nr:hypothetical protein [Acidobacteriota bacterium]